MATIRGLVLSNKQKSPDAVALRYKQLGIWNTYTWNDYYNEVSILVDAYNKSLSVSKGTVVAVYGNNVPKLIFSIAAVQTLGGIVALIHPESTEEELKTILNNSNAEILIAGCGTGQQLAYRKFYENSNITAVDLSLSSLAYAKRKTQELMYTRIRGE